MTIRTFNGGAQAYQAQQYASQAKISPAKARSIALLAVRAGKILENSVEGANPD